MNEQQQTTLKRVLLVVLSLTASGLIIALVASSLAEQKDKADIKPALGNVKDTGDASPIQPLATPAEQDTDSKAPEAKSATSEEEASGVRGKFKKLKGTIVTKVDTLKGKVTRSVAIKAVVSILAAAAVIAAIIVFVRLRQDSPQGIINDALEEERKRNEAKELEAQAQRNAEAAQQQRLKTMGGSIGCIVAAILCLLSIALFAYTWLKKDDGTGFVEHAKANLKFLIPSVIGTLLFAAATVVLCVLFSNAWMAAIPAILAGLFISVAILHHNYKTRITMAPWNKLNAVWPTAILGVLGGLAVLAAAAVTAMPFLLL